MLNSSLPGSNQLISRDQPRRGHAVCTLWCTLPPPPILPFLLKQNLSPKDIAGCNIMKLKVSQHIYASLVGKGLKLPIMPHTFLYYAPVMLISSFQYCVVLTRLSSVLLFCQSSSEWDGLVVSLVSVLVGISSSMLLPAPYSSLPHLTRCPSPSCDSCPSRE